MNKQNAANAYNQQFVYKIDNVTMIEWHNNLAKTKIPTLVIFFLVPRERTAR